MNKQQVTMNSRLVAHGWSKADILINDAQPGTEAIVYKGAGNSGILYPDGRFERMERATPRPQAGWYSPAAMARELGKADADARLIAKLITRPANATSHRQLQRGVKAVIRQLNRITGG